MPALGTKVANAAVVKGRPPLILQVQPDSYVIMKTPDQLRQWENDVKQFYGVAVSPSGGFQAAETCSGGCSDDCGII